MGAPAKGVVCGSATPFVPQGVPPNLFKFFFAVPYHETAELFLDRHLDYRVRRRKPTTRGSVGSGTLWPRQIASAPHLRVIFRSLTQEEPLAGAFYSPAGAGIIVAVPFYLFPSACARG